MQSLKNLRRIELSAGRPSMVQDQNPKLWHPARFTHGGIHGSCDGPFGPDIVKQHIVIILNNPLEDKSLLVDVCLEGIHHTRARSSGFYD